MFSTGFSSGFWTWFGVWSGGWSSQTAATTTKAPTKQQKFPWLNAQQIANIEKYTENLTWAEKNQEQQKLYQAMIQAIEAENFNDNRMAVNNERYRNSLTKTDPRECNFDQSACRQSTLVDMVKAARNLKVTTPEETVMSMFMQEMDYKGIGMDKLNAYLNNGDETILYEAWLKTNLWGTKDIINQASETTDKPRSEKSKVEKVEDVTNKTNVIGLWAEELDKAAGKFADKWLDWGTEALNKSTESLKSKIEWMSKEEVAEYRKKYEQLLKDKNRKVAQVEWNTVVSRLWNAVKWNLKYDYSDEDFMKWLISQKANLWESLTWADDFLKWENDPNVIQLFGNIPASAVKTFTATVRWMTNPYDTMKGLYILGKDVYDNWFENSAIWQRYGSWDAFAKALNEDPVWVADDALAVAEVLTWVAKWWLKLAWKATGSQSLVNTAGKIPVIWSANDALASKAVWGVYSVWDNLSKMTDSKLVWGVNRVLQAESNLGKMTEEWVKLYEAVKNSNFVDEMINKMVWLDKGDITFIKNNKDLVNDYISWKKNVETVLDDVKNRIEEKGMENYELWKEYDAIRENGQTVSTEALASDMVDRLRKNKITINADGDLEFDKLSRYNTAHKKALQDARQIIKDAQAAETVDAGTILDLRQKFDDIVNWTDKPTELRNMSSVDKATESLIKEMRWTIDARAKAWIDGLADLDAKYAPALEEMRQIKKDWFDSNGNIRDNARSKIRNLTKAGNEERLARLERLYPWITQDLKALDAALTVEKLTKNSVWQYYKWWGIALWLRALFTGNIPEALWYATVGVLATPKNFVKLIQLEPEIASKLMNGSDLSSWELSRLQAIASRIQDGENF